MRLRMSPCTVPKKTALAVDRLVPRIVTCVKPAIGPLFGLTAEIAGGATYEN